jgi:hypothetical protein
MRPIFDAAVADEDCALEDECFLFTFWTSLRRTAHAVYAR